MANIRVRVGQRSGFKVVSSVSGNQSMSLSQVSNVNALNPTDGMVLVYNASTTKWDATLDLTPGLTQNLDINGGNF